MLVALPARDDEPAGSAGARKGLVRSEGSYGPTLKAFEAVGAAGHEALLADILEAVNRFNQADDGTLVLQMDYLQVVATKR